MARSSAWMSFGLIAVICCSLVGCAGEDSKPLPWHCYLVDIDIEYNSGNIQDIDLPQLDDRIRESVLTTFVTKKWPEASSDRCGNVTVAYRGLKQKPSVNNLVLAVTFLYELKQGVEIKSADAQLRDCINTSLVKHDRYLVKFNLLTSIPALKRADGQVVQPREATFGRNIRYCCAENMNESCCFGEARFVARGDHSFCECNPGHYYELSNPSVCRRCPMGTHQPRTGKTHCDACDEGTTTTGDGATKCVPFSECKSEVNWKIEGVFTWKNTKGGTRVKHACPYGPANTSVARECLLNLNSKASWGILDASVCNRSQRTVSLFRLCQLPVNASNAHEVSKGLVEDTEKADELNAYDIALASLSLEAITDVDKTLIQVSGDFIKVLDNILSANAETLLASQSHNKTTSRMIKTTEKFAEKVPLWNDSFVLAAPNIELSVHKTTSEMRDEGFTVQINHHTHHATVTSSSSSGLARSELTVTSRAFQSAYQQGSTRFISVFYANNKLFPVVSNTENGEERSDTVPQPWDEERIGNVVLAAKFKGAQIVGVKDAVELNFPAETGINSNQTARCVFWDFERNDGFGNWSSEGCRSVGTDSSRVTCRCNHMTNFAMLLTADIQRDQSDEDHRNALSIISYVGCGVSLLATVLTLLTYTLFRYLRRSNAQLILCHLCVALIGLLVSFLVAATRTPNTTPCRVSSLLVHSFLLATFAWMGVEGMNMYLAFVKVVSAHVPRFMPKAIAISWGVPVVAVIVTASIAIDDYSSENSCFIHGIAFYASVFGPAVVILLVNLVMFGLTMYSLSQMGKRVSQENKVQGSQRVKVALAIMVLLGLTWLFGAMAIGRARLVFQYLFCVFNSLQGFAIFWFHCVRQPEVRECWVDFVCRGGSRKRRYTTSTMVPTAKKSTAASPNLSANDRWRAKDKCAVVKAHTVDTNQNCTKPV